MADPYLDVAAIRARFPDLTSTDKYPADVLEGHVATFEPLAERYRGVAFATRVTTGETHDIAAGGRIILLDWKLVHVVTAITVNGDAYTDGFTLDKVIGKITLHSGVPAGQAAVTYQHGHTERGPIAGATRACGLYVWHEATRDANPNTSNSYLARNEDLGVVEATSTANWEEGRPTGWIDVDGILNGLEDFRSDL